MPMDLGRPAKARVVVESFFTPSWHVRNSAPSASAVCSRSPSTGSLVTAPVTDVHAPVPSLLSFTFSAVAMLEVP